MPVRRDTTSSNTRETFATISGRMAFLLPSLLNRRFTDGFQKERQMGRALRKSTDLVIGHKDGTDAGVFIYNFNAIRGKTVTTSLLKAYYGTGDEFFQVFLRDKQFWDNNGGEKKRMQCENGAVDRNLFVRFMRHKKVTPKKFAGLSLGISSMSFDDVVSRLEMIGLVPQRYTFYPDVVGENLVQDIEDALPGINRNSIDDEIDEQHFYRDVHKAIEKEMGIKKIAPVYCSTHSAGFRRSTIHGGRLGDQIYANYID